MSFNIQATLSAVEVAKLLPLTEGEQFELGALLPNLDEGDEKVMWEVLENVRAYYHEIFLFSASCAIVGEKSSWRFS
jgi:hypothetical protein